MYICLLIHLLGLSVTYVSISSSFIQLVDGSHFTILSKPYLSYRQRRSEINDNLLSGLEGFFFEIPCDAATVIQGRGKRTSEAPVY